MINDLLVKVVDFHSMSLSTSLEGSHGDKLGNRGGFFNWDQSIKPPVACKYITFPVIDVSGRMPLCSTDYASEYLQGNISSSSIYDIWTDPNNIRLRKRIFRSQMDLEIANPVLWVHDHFCHSQSQITQGPFHICCSNSPSFLFLGSFPSVGVSPYHLISESHWTELVHKWQSISSDPNGLSLLDNKLTRSRDVSLLKRFRRLFTHS